MTNEAFSAHQRAISRIAEIACGLDLDDFIADIENVEKLGPEKDPIAFAKAQANLTLMKEQAEVLVMLRAVRQITRNKQEPSLNLINAAAAQQWIEMLAQR